MSNITIISHEADLDGVCSAVLLAQHFLGDPFYAKDKLSVKFANYDNAADIVKESALNSDELWIADLSFNDAELIPLIGMSSDKIHIFDHHASSRRCMEEWQEYAEIIFDDSGRQCAADLIYNYLITKHGNQRFSDREHLVKATHSRDLWIKDEIDGEYLTDVIAGLGAEKTYKLLIAKSIRSQYLYFTPEMKVCVKFAAKSRADSMSLARSSRHRRNVEIITPDGVRRSCMLVTAYCIGHSSDVGDMLYNEENGHCWVALVDLPRNALSFRCDHKTVDATGIAVNTIAKAFNGGGHPVAAGGKLPGWILDQTLCTLADEIKDFISKINGK